MCKPLFTSLLLLAVTQLQAQLCTLPGQTPSTAFTLCDNGTYIQPKLPSCRNNSFFVPGCTNQNTNYGDNNPVYYSFTCRTAGSLALTITPLTITDDLDWILFDITGRNPNIIFNDRTVLVTGNLSSNGGTTGASASGVNYLQCRSNPALENKPTFSSMPQLQAGHQYLLMIGSMNDNANGFTLFIGGGTANISSTVTQEINGTVASCDNKQLLLKFSKKIRCSSIAPDGSDFSLSPASVPVLNAAAVLCNNTGETDAVLITFANPLPNGQYVLTIKKGNDNNTLTDQCSNSIIDPTQIKFSVSPFGSIDTILPVSCEPVKLKIKLTKPVLCNSIAADGSDFTIFGPSTVIINSVTAFCSNTLFADSLEISLQQPISTPGVYTFTIKNGTDANTLVDACNISTPAGTSTNVTIKGKVNAAFTFSVKEGCVADTINLEHPGGDGVNSWSWTVDTINSSLQQPVILLNRGGNVLAELLVSNGLCSAVSQQVFALKPKLNIQFSTPDSICADEPVQILNKSINAVNWFWDFGNGITSSLENPPIQYYPFADVDKQYTISLTGSDGNCSITKNHLLLVEASCSIAMPTAFTPNGDGLNDFFKPLKTSGASGMQLVLYNRYGQRVFQSSGNNVQWNGLVNGQAQPAGMYTWQLTYIDRKTAKQIILKGTVLLIR